MGEVGRHFRTYEATAQLLRYDVSDCRAHRRESEPAVPDLPISKFIGKDSIALIGVQAPEALRICRPRFRAAQKLSMMIRRRAAHFYSQQKGPPSHSRRCPCYRDQDIDTVSQCRIL